jgi:hypothetical protein
MADPNDGGKIDDRKFQVIVSAHDDCRRQIAAGKVQRWDVVKWGVTVNVALATAAAEGQHHDEERKPAASIVHRDGCAGPRSTLPAPTTRPLCPGSVSARARR